MYGTAFITGTFDELHSDHIELLKNIKQLAKVLVVGLVTDRLAEVQKRRTLHTYEHRKALVLLLADVVIPHNGETQYEHVHKLRPDVVVTGDEYINSDEFQALREKCDIPIIAMPRGYQTSSTTIINRIHSQFIGQARVLANGVGGPVMIYNSNTVVKYSTIQNCETSDKDVYLFYSADSTIPRNWKGGHNPITNLPQTETYPNVAGYPHREAVIMAKFKSFDWCPYMSHYVNQGHDSADNVDATSHTEPRTRTADAINSARRNSTTTISLVMKYAGVTLDQWLPGQSQAAVLTILHRLRTILSMVKCMGIIHGDIHPSNILIDHDQKVSIIDWQWCQSITIYTTKAEHDDLMAKVHVDFDWLHFCSACRSYPTLVQAIETMVQK